MGKKISDIAGALILTLFLLSASVSFTLTFRPLYYLDVEILRIEETSGYTKAQIYENYNALIDYNLRPDQQTLRFPSFPMSENARIHFQEVKRIFQFFLKAAAGTAVLLLFLIPWKKKKRQHGYLKTAGILAPLLVLGAAAAIAGNWDRAFVLFHELVFQNDYWLFDAATDPVILILPDTFFLHCAVLILALIAAGSAMCLYAGFRPGHGGKKRAKRKSRKTGRC